MSTNPLDDFRDFAAAVRHRLEQGRIGYRDRSFERPVGELVGEIREELLDVAAWSYIALQRIERLQAEGQPRVQRGEQRPVVAEREPSRPYATELHGIPLTAAQAVEVERRARNGAITASLVWAVKTESEESASR